MRHEPTVGTTNRSTSIGGGAATLSAVRIRHRRIPGRNITMGLFYAFGLLSVMMIGLFLLLVDPDHMTIGIMAQWESVEVNEALM